MIEIHGRTRGHALRARSRSFGPGLLALVLLLAATSLPALAADAPQRRGAIDINTASLEELQQLPGVGESRASAIVSTREARGGFKSVDELGEVRGIGDGLLEKLRPLVTVKSGKTASRP